jgi:hypothetical protein
MRLFVHTERRKTPFPPVVKERAAMRTQIMGVGNHVSVPAGLALTPDREPLTGVTQFSANFAIGA